MSPGAREVCAKPPCRSAAAAVPECKSRGQRNAHPCADDNADQGIAQCDADDRAQNKSGGNKTASASGFTELWLWFRRHGTAFARAGDRGQRLR